MTKGDQAKEATVAKSATHQKWTIAINDVQGKLRYMLMQESNEPFNKYGNEFNEKVTIL